MPMLWFRVPPNSSRPLSHAAPDFNLNFGGGLNGSSGRHFVVGCLQAWN
jgi:hypothetical protein